MLSIAYELVERHTGGEEISGHVPSFPGTAGSTMLVLATSLLADGDEVAPAGDSGSWPELGDDNW